MQLHLSAEQHSATAQSLAIVVADDAIDTQQSIRRWLLDLGHEVFCASSGQAAIRLIQQRTIDLVITEVLLPNGDGLELITALRKLQPSARVIAMSGGGRYLSATECLRVAKGLGAQAVLRKPLGKDELIYAVSEVMAPARSSRPRLIEDVSVCREG